MISYAHVHDVGILALLESADTRVYRASAPAISWHDSARIPIESLVDRRMDAVCATVRVALADKLFVLCNSQTRGM
jgi:hypothetical protein